MNGKNGKSRGQAAMEYLMTYGWALLVIVVVLAILLIINPFQAPQGCRFDQIGFSCSDPLVDSNGTLYLTLTNGNSNNIELYGINCTTDKAVSPPAFVKANVPSSDVINMQRQQPWSLNSTRNGIVVPGIPCYDSTGAQLKPAAGSDFTGKLWIFYNNEEDGSNYPVRSTSATVTTKVVAS